jgi:hypothetical protein
MKGRGHPVDLGMDCIILKCEFLGSNGGEDVDVGFLGCNTLWACKEM